MDAPSPKAVREELARFDARRQKIVAGMLAVMIQDPEHVRDREWIARKLAEVTVMAGEFDADSPHAGVAAVEEFLKANAAELLNASFLLFQRVGLDLAPRSEEALTVDDALRCGLGYLPSVGGGRGGSG